MNKKSCVVLTNLANTSIDNLVENNVCRYCGRKFASSVTLNRHIKNSCKIAGNPERTNKIVNAVDHVNNSSLQKELLEMKEHAAKMEAKMEQMTELLSKQSVSITGTVAGTINNTQTNNVTVWIHPWDGNDCINVPTDQIATAFRENDKLREYTELGSSVMASHTTGIPYVDHMLMDFVKRAHSIQSNRNVYLSANRADQALALMKSGEWEVLPLLEAIQKLLDGVDASMRRAWIDPEEAKQLPLAARNALAVAGMLYQEGPVEYAKRAKKPMEAHLTNCRSKLTGNEAPDPVLLPPIPKRPTPPPVKSELLNAPSVARKPTVPEYKLNAERAAELFMRMRPQNGNISPEYIKMLAGEAATPVDYLIKKLWEAVEEDPILKGEDAELALAVVAEYDSDKSLYD